MIVILIGYMASGKSTLGKMLAERLDYTFIDLDDYLEEKEAKSVNDIFETKGEIYFRKIETQYLKELLSEKSNLVLSLGGGTPCYSNNMDMLLNANNTKSVYLKASISELVNRLKNKKHKRPLVAHIESEDLLKEFIGKHLFERSQFYNLANLTITTDNKKKKEIVEELLFALELI